MYTILIITFFIGVFYSFIQFARQEYVQEGFENTIIDIEGRLAWANSRRSFPFGMKAQLEVTCDLLAEAKNLWQKNKWHEAYRIALKSQNAMNRAQSIYCRVLKTRQQQG